jgi:hypothetical protein
VLPYESNTSQKLLLEAIETKKSSLANWMVWFYQFRRQSGAPLAFNEEASPLAKQHLDGGGA